MSDEMEIGTEPERRLGDQYRTPEADRSLPPIPLHPLDRYHVIEGSDISGGCHCARWVVMDRRPPGRLVAYFYRPRDAQAYARLSSDVSKQLEEKQGGPAEKLLGERGNEREVTFNVVTGLPKETR